MVVDILEKSQVNIKDLVLPKSEDSRRLTFNPEKDITSQEWATTLKYLEHCRAYQDRHEETFTRPLLGMRILFPKRVGELRLDEKDFEAMKWLLDFRARSSDKDWDLRYVYQAVAMKMLFPDRYSSLGINKEWNYYKKVWKRELNWGVVSEEHQLIKRGALMKILNPQKMADFKEDEIKLSSIQDVINSKNHRDKILDLAEILAYSRMLLPVNYLQLAPNRKMQRDLYNGLQRIRQGQQVSSREENKNWIGYRSSLLAEYGMFLGIIAADEVRINDKGLELVIPDSPIATKPDVPTVRNF